MKETGSKLQWANNLRAAATIGVIMLHTASTISEQFPDISRKTFFYTTLADSSVRWCVPVFVMISGSFALPNYNGDLKGFFKKIFYRILLPFIFWSIVYLLYFNWRELFYSGKDFIQLAAFAGDKFLVGTASHLWYVYLILSLYLLFPFLSKWIAYASSGEIKLFLYLWALFLFLAPLLEDKNISFEYSYFTGFIGYILWGYYFFNRNKKANLWIIGLLFLSAYVFTVIVTFNLSVKDGNLNESFMDDLMPNVVLMAFCVYLFFQNRKILQLPLWRYLIDAICKNSYGIYLAHLLVLNLFLDAGIPYNFIHPLISIPVITLACFGVSFSIIYLMKKIRLLKLVAG